MDLALGMMKPARAGPAITACKNRLIALFSFHPGQLVSDQLFSKLPGDRNKFVCAAPA